MKVKIFLNTGEKRFLTAHYININPNKEVHIIGDFWAKVETLDLREEHITDFIIDNEKIKENGIINY